MPRPPRLRRPRRCMPRACPSERTGARDFAPSNPPTLWHANLSARRLTPARRLSSDFLNEFADMRKHHSWLSNGHAGPPAAGDARVLRRTCPTQGSLTPVRRSALLDRQVAVQRTFGRRVRPGGRAASRRCADLVGAPRLSGQLHAPRGPGNSEHAGVSAILRVEWIFVGRGPRRAARRRRLRSSPTLRDTGVIRTTPVFHPGSRGRRISRHRPHPRSQ